MMQVRAKTIVVILGAFGFIYYAMITLHYKYKCNVRFDSSKFENATYFLLQNHSSPSPGYHLLPASDYNSLINLNFTFTMLNLVCDNTEPLLLVLIHTAPKNFEKRKVIRETWGMSREDTKVLFLLGTPDDLNTQEKLQNENFLYNDLLQGSFLDTYRNLTYKHVMGLKFVTYHCPQTKYIFKVDDDVCVNMPMLTNFLKRDLSPHGAVNLLMCSVIHKTEAVRSSESKWMVTFGEYPEEFYPPYCLGWYILYSPDMAFKLYREAQRTEYFWIDDVLVTGVVAAKLKFAGHTDISSLTLSKREVQNAYTCRPFLVGRADMAEREIRSLWAHIKNTPVPQSVTLVTENYHYSSITVERKVDSIM